MSQEERLRSRWQDRANPRVVVFVGIIFTSFSAIFIRLSQAHVLAIGANRLLITTLLIAPLYVREVRRARIDDEARTPRGTFLLMGLSGLFLAVHFATWFYALELTTIASATFIVNSNPLIAALLGFLLFKERLTRRSLGFILGILVGGFVLAAGDISISRQALLGDLFAFAGAASLAGYMIIGRYVRSSVSSIRYVFLVYATSGIALTLGAIASGVTLFHYPLREYFIFGGLALFCTVLGHSSFNWALEHLKASTIATFSLAEPVLATLLGMAFFAEIPPWTTFAGGLTMLMGIGFFVREEYRSSTE